MADKMAFNGHLHSAAVEATATASNQYVSGTLEDGEIKQEQDDSPSHGNELQLCRLAYDALENRYSQLQHQHTELQALVAAYSEVIRGSAPAADGDVSINQLRAEAGHDGLRARALETDALRSLIREAGGFRELEQVVSDLRRIRDMSDDLKSSRGIVGLASQVGDLLQCKQRLTKLQNEVNHSNGLKAKAARYERLMQAFADVQIDTSPQLAPSFASSLPARTQMATQQPVQGSASMNPARARMISARPLEDDPDRDLYEAPRVSKPQNQTGSNFTPLGNMPKATLKRKVAQHKDLSATLKRPRVDLGRATALVESTLPATTNTGRRFGTAAFGTRTDTLGVQARSSLGFPTYTDLPEPASEATNAPASMPPRGFAGPGARSLDMGLKWQGTSKKPFEEPITQGTAPYVGKFPAVGIVSTGASALAIATPIKAECGNQGPAAVPENTTVSLMQTAADSVTMPRWMRSQSFFVDSKPTISSATPMSSCSLSPPSHDVQLHADIRSGQARLPGQESALDLPNRRLFWPFSPLTATCTAPTALNALQPLQTYPATLWVGAAEGFTVWDACQSYDLKKASQIPDDLLQFLQSELAREVSNANASKFTQMVPSGNTCIATYMADGLRSDLPQERRACQKCSSAARPCALLQIVSGVRTVIFLPIREHLRIGKEWTDKSYWVRT